MEHQNINPKKNQSILEKIRKKLATKAISYGLLGTTMLGSIYTANNFLKDNKEIKTNNSAAETNYKSLKKNENLIFACIAYVEDFSPVPYFCGAKWTIGYGSTVDKNGLSIREFTDAISENTGKKYASEHLEKLVFPFIKEHVKISLNDEELIATAMFIYNIGGENFSGHNIKKEKVGEPSSFLKAINRGARGEECAKMFTGFRASAGKLAKGLPKRHWIAGAIFAGKISPQQILSLEPCKFYGDKINFYFKEKGGEKVEFYTPNYSEEKIAEFLNKNNNFKKATLLIVDDNTRQDFLQNFSALEAFAGTDVVKLRKKISDDLLKQRIQHSKKQEKQKRLEQKNKNRISANSARARV